ncbi:hypothetical protein ACWEGE_38575 [Amycolatopsis sp. NPDC004747]
MAGEYGNNGTGQPNVGSFVQLVTALRAAMPTKLISLYNIGPAASQLSYGELLHSQARTVRLFR